METYICSGAISPGPDAAPLGGTLCHSISNGIQVTPENLCHLQLLTHIPKFTSTPVLSFEAFISQLFTESFHDDDGLTR